MNISLIAIPAADAKRFNLVDRYRVHQWLFQNHFAYSMSREFLFKVKGFSREVGLTVLTVSKEAPTPGVYLIRSKEVDLALFKKGAYKVHMQVNPTVKRGGKVLGVTEPAAVKEWFARKGVNHGYTVRGESLNVIDIKKTRYVRGDSECTVCNATLEAILEVSDEAKFQEAMLLGIGRSKAVGFGLIEAQPCK